MPLHSRKMLGLVNVLGKVVKEETSMPPGAINALNIVQTLKTSLAQIEQDLQRGYYNSTQNDLEMVSREVMRAVKELSSISEKL